jgi:phytoene dehydrogenase-like protein
MIIKYRSTVGLDKAEIKDMCREIKQFAKIDMPVQDVKGVKVRSKSRMPLSTLTAMMRIVPKMGAYQNISAKEYIQRFRHPGIRALLENVVGETLSANSMMFTLGCLASGDGGYAEGGSLAMALNMAKRFTQLGGAIRYSSPVEKVAVENGKAVGAVVSGETVKADAVIVTADTMTAVDHLFDSPLHEPWMDEMRRNVKFMADSFVCIGVEADLSAIPEKMIFPLDPPFTFAGVEYRFLGLNNYASYKGYAPEGCTAMTAIFIGDTYDYWKAKKESGEYEAEKQRLADEVLKLVVQKLPQSAGKVKVLDVATPLTYERYCGTCRGSWMTLMEKGDPSSAYPSVSESIGNLYFAGQRIQPPGGLPVAVDTGRRAVQYLCLDAGAVFQGKIS